jgi:hypothetical protein
MRSRFRIRVHPDARSDKSDAGEMQPAASLRRRLRWR